jgi:hypothetical protein
MTKKLENLFDLPDLNPGDDSSVQALHDNNDKIIEQKKIIAQVDEAIDKIDTALPQCVILKPAIKRWMTWLD